MIIPFLLIWVFIGFLAVVYVYVLCKETLTEHLAKERTKLIEEIETTAGIHVVCKNWCNEMNKIRYG